MHGHGLSPSFCAEPSFIAKTPSFNGFSFPVFCGTACRRRLMKADDNIVRGGFARVFSPPFSSCDILWNIVRDFHGHAGGSCLSSFAMRCSASPSQWSKDANLSWQRLFVSALHCSCRLVQWWQRRMFLFLCGVEDEGCAKSLLRIRHAVAHGVCTCSLALYDRL